MAETYILTLSCVDHPGIVAAVSTVLARHGANILEAQQFDDLLTGRFFMRVEFALVGGAKIAQLEAGFAEVAADHGFPHAGRFAQYYTQLFGESPSQARRKGSSAG